MAGLNKLQLQVWGRKTFNFSASLTHDKTVAEGYTGLWVSPDGTKLYRNDSFTKNFIRYTMSAFDISSLASPQTFNNAITNGYSITMSEDGVYLYLTRSGNSNIFRYTLSTPFDLSTAVLTKTQSGFSNTTRGLIISADGSRFWLGNQSGIAQEYSLSTAYDITTKSAILNSVDIGMYSFSFTNGGLTIIGVTDGYLKASKLTTAYDITTIVETIVVSSANTTILSQSFYRNGYLFVSKNYIINQYQITF